MSLEFTGFESWTEVLAFVDSGGHNSLRYHAPMDINPVPVTVFKRFKNGKLRLSSGEVTFTADSGHLSRIYSRTLVSR